MSQKENLYALLGVSKDATAEEIRRAYHDAARRLHPDVNVEPGATELFLVTKQAYEVLSDPAKRAAYDASLPAETKVPPAFLRTQYSRSAIPRLDEQQVVYSILDLSANLQYTSESKEIPTPPLNLSLVLDRSTSMQGERMDTVKSAAIELLRQLRPEDTLSIIVFSDRAQVLLPAKRQPDRGQVETQIRMIKAGGGTEIMRGLDAGFFEVRRNLSANSINHIILITDGQTYGDEEDCIKLARKAAEYGIGISGLGIGEEWNDTFLDSLATRTGGSSAYISNASDIKTFLQDRFKELNRVFAKQVSLDFETGPGIEMRYAFRLEPDPMPTLIETPIRLGSIPKGSSLKILLEFVISPIPSYMQDCFIGTGKFTLDIPSNSNSDSKLYLKLARPVGGTAKMEIPSEDFLQAVSQVTLYRMQEQARKDVGEGNIIDASRRLQNLATHLLAQGRRDLAHTVLMEAEYIHNTHGFSVSGEKRIKYGTRALLLPAKTEGNQI